MNIFDYIHSTTIEPTGAYQSHYMPHKESGAPSDHGANANTPATDKYDRHSIKSEQDDTLHRINFTYNESDYSHIATCHCGTCPACSSDAEQEPEIAVALAAEYQTPQEVESPQERQKAANELSEADQQQLEKMRTEAIRDFVIAGRLRRQ